MPLIGLICPNEMLVDFDFCLNKCEDRCTPYPLAYTIIADTVTGFHQGDALTATSILGCLRKTYLERITDYYSSFDKLWYAARGTWMHATLERLRGDPRWMVEERFHVTIGDITISGQIDAYNIFDKHLIDYKSIKDRGVDNVKEHGPKQDHIIQVSIYKRFLEYNDLLVKKTSVVYMAMSAFHECKHVFTQSADEVDSLIIKNGNIMLNAFKNSILPSIPVPRPFWLCNTYCPVMQKCVDLENLINK